MNMHNMLYSHETDPPESADTGLEPNVTYLGNLVRLQMEGHEDARTQLEQLATEMTPNGRLARLELQSLQNHQDGNDYEI